jgi:hypothetical protein
MSAAKLKIDLSAGTVDVEGSEEFVSLIYKDFKARLDAVEPNTKAPDPARTALTPPPSPPPHAASRKSAKSKRDVPESKTKKTPAGKYTPSMLKNLDLGGQGKTERLKDFYGRYAPTTNMERNLIFAYYLQHKLDMTGITADHIFTCYRNVGGVKAPEAMRQSLLDTAGRRGWLDVGDWENIVVPISGVNYLEHDMPKKASE